MDINKDTVLIHPFVARARAMLARPHSPVLTVRDVYQPSSGYLLKKLFIVNSDNASRKALSSNSLSY